MRRQLALIFAATGILAGCATTPQQSDSQKTAGQAGNGVYGPNSQAATAYNQNDLLGRIRAGFRLPELDTPLVRAHEQWYEKRPAYVGRMMDRSSRYLYYIAGEVEKRNMPMEIALLPMIESAYNPVAYSRSNASGIWQFVPSTGRDYGLRQNHWIDNRRDIKAATNAALNYLSKLYRDFGDWDLAIAAYNCGEGLVARTIARQRAAGLPTDYLHLPLPDETRNYVPKLMAVKHIILKPEAYHLTINLIPNQAYFREVKVQKHLPIQDAARLAGLSVSEFLALNPSFKKSVIPAYAGALLLPVKNADQFEQSLASYENPLTGWQYYKAHRGEKIADIARRSGISVAYLEQVNHLPARVRLAEDQTLLAPPALIVPPTAPTMVALGPEPGTRAGRHAAAEAAPMATAALADIAPAPASPHEKAADEARLTQVASAEPVAHARRARLAEPRRPVAHHEPDSDAPAATHLARLETPAPVPHHAQPEPAEPALRLAASDSARPAETVARPSHPGNRLASAETAGKPVPVHEDSASTRHPLLMARATQADHSVLPHFYHVKFGDTIYNIARRLAVSPDDVRLWNNLNSNHIYLGQRLAVKGGNLGELIKTSVAAAPPSSTRMLALADTHQAMANVTSYTVRLGDTLHSIARHFHVQVADLVRWNTHRTMTALRPGDKVKVYLAQQ